MNTHLSKNEINSYRGDIVPLCLKTDNEIPPSAAKWHASNDNVLIKEFSSDAEFPFSNGVLVTLLNVGSSTITCSFGGEEYSCKVSVRERRHASSLDDMKFFKADLHIHASLEHDHIKFAERETEFPEDLIESVKDCGELSCAVITDHADTLNQKDFFRGFIADSECEHDGIVFFPGAESEVTLIEKDRFGLSHKNSGEIVTLNAAYYSNSYTWEDFYGKFSDSPFAVMSLAHPNVVGFDQNGMWNFCIAENSRNKDFRRLVRLVEAGRDDYQETSMLYQYTYSQALDCGLKVSPCCTSDSHGKYTPIQAKTFIVSPENSREMFYDAIVNNRVYGSESGTVRIGFTVNGQLMGSTLDPSVTDYQIHIDAAVAEGEEKYSPIECSVISDRGIKVKVTEFKDSADIALTSDSARYFYVILTDRQGLKTYSAPVWTGREFNDLSYLDALVPIDKESFSATDEKSGTSIPEVINGDPTAEWCSDSRTASVIIDMKKEHTVRAVSYYAPPIHRDKFRDPAIIRERALSFAHGYRIYLSRDGISYTLSGEGCIRTYGGEDILPVSPETARYVRFEVTSTVGAETRKPEFANAPVTVGEISIFE